MLQTKLTTVVLKKIKKYSIFSNFGCSYFTHLLPYFFLVIQVQKDSCHKRTGFETSL